MTNTDAWGIDRRYQDGLEQWHDVSGETRKALLSAMDAEHSSAPEEPPLRIVTQDEKFAIPEASELELEDGARFRSGSRKHPLPIGYHTLRDLDSNRETRLIVAPQTCYLREQFRTWGWSIQLYALRSHSSWGMGDLADLKQLSNWSDSLGAGLIMTNPLSTATPAIPQQPSPYYPSSRLFRNPLYLRIEEVPEARVALPDLHRYSAQGRALNQNRLIDHDAIYRLKQEALENIWAQMHEKIQFPEYEQEQGQNLKSFATFCSLVERHGPDWHQWPSDFRHPDSAATRNFAREFPQRVRFHKWIQWLLDRQLLDASERRMILQDLPIGVNPGGADAWLWQDVLAKNVSVGAPPDPFSETGQDWGLPPFAPHKLRALGYEPFVQTLRAAMRYSAGLRIDHAMGLFRLFWISAGESPKKGAYVRYNADEMLSILALESVRAQAFVVGEDLGTVEPGVREKLAQFRVLSYRVMWFEENPPALYPELSLASITTHDLPTLAGVWSGADFKEQKKVGMKASEESLEKNRTQIEKIAEVDASAPLQEVIVKTHAALAQAPSTVILASLDDALGVEQRPNLPGTMNDVRPNWTIPLPKTLEEIRTDSTVLQVAALLEESVRNNALAAEAD